MKLTVLGRNGPFPAPGGACSGYLIEAGKTKLCAELGSGALGRLRNILPGLELDGILLSHLHSDHISDMLVLRYALTQLSARGAEIALPMTVVAPETPETEFRQLASSGVFEMVHAKAGLKLRFGEVTVTLYSSAHPVETYAFNIGAGVYSIPAIRACTRSWSANAAGRIYCLRTPAFWTVKSRAKTPRTSPPWRRAG